MNLHDMKITHFYTDYWTCDSTVFVSKEHIICSSIDNALLPHYNRYLPYVSHRQIRPLFGLRIPARRKSNTVHLLKNGTFSETLSTLRLRWLCHL